MSKKDCEPKQNLNKIVSQVKALSKTVNELEKEIEALKKICRKKDKKTTTSSNESKNIAKAPSKTSSPFRLNFFRKSDKTKENVTPNETSKMTKTNKKGDDSSRESILSNISHSNLKPPSKKNYADNNNSGEIKKNRLSTQKQVQLHYSNSDTCCCKSKENKINNLKKSKIDKDKIKSRKRMCSEDCPYLPKQTYRDNIENNSRKPFKNKKLMVNLIGSNRDFKDKMRRNKNFVLDCKFLQNADFGKLTQSRDGKQRRRIKLFDCGESKNLKSSCGHCSKNCKTKNVLKIKKAILTQEPPMIFISPDLENSKIRCGKKKRKKLPENEEICCEDHCPSMGVGRAEHCDACECPCSSFAAAINARYNKSCQTEIPRK